MEIVKSTLESKKDIVKASNTVNTVKELKDQNITLVGAVIFNRQEIDQETGEVETKTACVLKAKDNTFYSSISQTVIKSLETILATFEQGEISEGIDIKICSSKSNKGREFFFIDLV